MTNNVIGKPLARVDGWAKVTGSARYAADFNQESQAYAVIVSATVGLGRVAEIELGGSVAHAGRHRGDQPSQLTSPCLWRSQGPD